jgi:hypothetical protein
MEESISGVSPTRSARKTRSETSRLTLSLLLGGLVLVGFSQQIGQICVETRTPQGGVIWSAEDADRAALTFRCLGGMAFVWGLAERLISALTRERP